MKDLKKYEGGMQEENETQEEKTLIFKIRRISDEALNCLRHIERLESANGRLDYQEEKVSDSKASLTPVSLNDRLSDVLETMERNNHLFYEALEKLEKLI